MMKRVYKIVCTSLLGNIVGCCIYAQQPTFLCKYIMPAATLSQDNRIKKQKKEIMQPQNILRVPSQVFKGLSFFNKAGIFLDIQEIILSYLTNFQETPERMVKVEDNFYPVCTTSDGYTVFSGHKTIIRRWNMGSEKQDNPAQTIMAAVGEKDAVGTLCVSPHERILFSGHLDGNISIFSIDAHSRVHWQPKQRIKNKDSVDALCMAPDGNLLFSAHGDTIKIWQMTNNDTVSKKIHQIKQPGTIFHALCVSPNGDTLFSMSDVGFFFGIIKRWKIEKFGFLEQSPHTPTGLRSSTLCIGPEGDALFSGDNKHSWRISMHNGAIVQNPSAHRVIIRDWMTHFCMSRNGQILFSAFAGFIKRYITERQALLEYAAQNPI